jgi:hypothetical protein
MGKRPVKRRWIGAPAPKRCQIEGVDVCAPTSEFIVLKEKQLQVTQDERVRAKCRGIHNVGVEPWRPYAFLPDIRRDTNILIAELNWPESEQ